MDKIRKHKFVNGWRLLVVSIAVLWLTGCEITQTPIVTTEHTTEIEKVALLAIVSRIDEVNGKISLRAVVYDSEIELNYNGGVDVRDKYGDIMSMKQITVGSIVDITYDPGRQKMLSLYQSASENVRRIEHLSGVVIDNGKQVIHINDKLYPMSENICAFSEDKEIKLNEICSEDQVTVWLYNDMICSVYVELGHGYVRLTDYASYIGGMLEIGYDLIVPVTEDMLLTVREGEYTLRIAKDKDVGVKKVVVFRDQETELSLADIAVEPKQVGSVLFQVKPVGATVYIDGRRVNIEGAIELTYGKHRIQIMADGYDSYSASFEVNYAYKVKEYSLNQTGSRKQTNAKQEHAMNQESAEKKNSGTTEKNYSQTGDDMPDTEENKTETKDVTASDSVKTNNKVTVQAPVGVSVYFDGEYLGIAPISFTKITGSHIMTFSQAGFLSKSYTVIFTDDGKDENLQYDALVSISSLIEDS